MALQMPNALIMSFSRQLLSKYKLLVGEIWQQHGKSEHVRTERQSLGFRWLNVAQLVSCSEHQPRGLLLFKTTKYFCSYISLYENVNLNPCKIKPGWKFYLIVGYQFSWRDYVDFVIDTFRAMCIKM